MNSDKFYTPSELANRMVSYVVGEKHKFIADFACGNGELLKAGAKKWQKSKILGTDICRNTIKYLRRQEPNWQLGQCNFLLDSSKKMCKALRGMENKVSLLLLNPPFSLRGGSSIQTRINGSNLKSSIALSFILNALPFLANTAEIIAILPLGCLNSEKDEQTWRFIKGLGEIKILDMNGYNVFKGATARTVLVHFLLSKSKEKMAYSLLESGRSLNEVKEIVKKSSNGKQIVSIYRGKISMHLYQESFAPRAIPFVHSTELEEGGLNLSRRRTDKKLKKVISGPAILLPRVGKPNPKKIHFYDKPEPIALSDCVIGVKCSNQEQGRNLHHIILKNWSILENSYGGTCARYLTLKKFSEFLSCYGFKIEQSSFQ